MSTFPEINQIVQTRCGPMLYNKHDVYIGRSLALYGEFSLGEIELFQQLIRPGDVVVEAGANVGAHSVVLGQLAGRTGRVYAFEPQRIVFQTLCANLALNNLTNVFAQQAGLGAQAGQIVVPSLDYSQSNNFGGLNLKGHVQGETVPLQTIDALELKRCRLIKIDVEGMEQEVLEGAQQTINQHQPVIYAEADRDELRVDLFRYLDSLGYNLYLHTPPLFNPGNFNGVAENVFGAFVSKNILCVHQDKKQEIQGAEPLPIP